jgi:hypothetical protein
MALKRLPEKKWVYRQPPEPYMPVPSAGMLLGPSASGKSSTACSLITGPFRTVFDAVWVFSPSAKIDSVYEPLEKHFKTLKNGGGLIGEWDLAKLEEIIEEQKKTTAEEKLKNQKTPLTSVLLFLDDWSDHPELMKAGLITQLYTRSRHYGLSVWVLSQKMCSVGLCCRVNLRWIIVWRLRSAKEIECVMHELSAIHPARTLLALYHEAIDDQPFSFWYVNMTVAVRDMFYVRFEEKLVID